MKKLIICFGLVLFFMFTTVSFVFSQNSLTKVTHKTVFNDEGRKITHKKTFYKQTIQNEISEKSVYDNISLYPNPATEFIEITLADNHRVNPVVESGEIEIYNVLGEKVMTVETRHALSLHKIDISHLPHGIYFVKIGGNIEKFIKK